jgi:hypothetical protein
MHKILRACALSLLFWSLAAYPVLSGLKDFSDESKNAEKRKSSSSGSSSNSSASSNSSDDMDGCFDPCGEIIGMIIADMYMYANFPVRYAPYPYCNSEYKDSFITRENVRKSSDDKFILSRDEGFPDNTRAHYYSLSAGYHYAGDNVKCGFFSARGKFWKMIGPEAEYRMYSDKDGKLHVFSAGLNIPLFQFDLFSPDFYIGFGGFRGMLDRNGLSIGGSLSIYPFKPVIFTMKGGVLRFDKILYREFDYRLGIILNRYELFGGYRTLYSKDISSKLKGFETGIRVWL